MKRNIMIFALLLACLQTIKAETPQKKIQINVKGVVFNMIYVEPGTFTMGATNDESYDEREHPSHTVTLTRGYYIAETEVTQALWEAVMGNNPSEHIGKNKPVDHVTWDDCSAFASILSVITGRHFRLPTEAEWEYAAKGGNKSKNYIYSGSNNLDDVGWYVVNSGDKPVKDKVYLFGADNNSETHNVKTKKPNELGIYDMSGNVDEWCDDEYTDYTSEKQYDPKAPSFDLEKVQRGGSFKSPSRHCRNTFRVGFELSFCLDTDGFRLAMENEE